MTALICLLLNLGASLFKPKSRLEAENAALCHQLAVLQRKVRGRVRLTNSELVIRRGDTSPLSSISFGKKDRSEAMKCTSRHGDAGDEKGVPAHSACPIGEITKGKAMSCYSLGVQIPAATGMFNAASDWAAYYVITIRRQRNRVPANERTD
jgi:hypothetical protein